MKCKACNGSGIEPNQRVIGEELRANRKELRISLNEVADFIGVTPQFLCDLEHGRRKWSTWSANDYLKYLVRKGKA
jgi:transcriptional regulator with XRE-family HTH domain